MEFISRMARFWLDFLFPKTRSVVELESLSDGELLERLPPAPPTESEDLVALFDYSHPVVKEMVWELKYGGNKQVASKLGHMLYDLILDELDERGAFESEEWQKERPLLIPVPVSDKRRFERGWNQAELLTKAIAKCDREKRFKHLPRHLAKLRHTESQTTTASKAERLKNIKDSMKFLHAPAAADRSVILVDDVLTTGATFAEAKRALRAAGAKRIICIAAAH